MFFPPLHLLFLFSAFAFSSPNTTLFLAAHKLLVANNVVDDEYPFHLSLIIHIYCVVGKEATSEREL